MTIDKAKSKFREFHLKEPKKEVALFTQIPRIVHPIGFCPQISYNSNKWNKESEWKSYIHWWEHPTLVCVQKDMLGEFDFDFESGFFSDQRFDLGPGRKEVTFLGYAIDFSVTGDDRSKISVNPSTEFIKNYSPETEGEKQRLSDSVDFEFDRTPGQSQDYVVCSPNGHIVYVIAGGKDVFAFINENCRVTKHGIEG